MGAGSLSPPPYSTRDQYACTPTTSPPWLGGLSPQCPLLGSPQPLAFARAAALGQLCGPPNRGAGREGLALLQTWGPGEAEACRELSQLQAPRATGTRPVTQVPGVHGIFSRTSIARASWRTLTRATGRWGHALSLGRVTHAEAPAVRPGTGAPPSAWSQLSLGAAGVGRRPSPASCSPSTFDPSPRGSDEQASGRLAQPGLPPPTTWAWCPCAVSGLRSAHVRLFSAGQDHPGQRRGGSGDRKQVVGSARKSELWSQDQELDWPRWAPPSKLPAR